jgi:hypothetical protein
VASPMGPGAQVRLHIDTLQGQNMALEACEILDQYKHALKSISRQPSNHLTPYSLRLRQHP